MSPTARSLVELRRLGYLAAILERWNPFAKIRQDLFGFADLLAVKEGESIPAIQTATGANASARIHKIAASEPARTWLRCGHGLEIWAWSVKGARGERKTWSLDRRPIEISNG